MTRKPDPRYRRPNEQLRKPGRSPNDHPWAADFVCPHGLLNHLTRDSDDGLCPLCEDGDAR